jgi:hypothetical protein
MNMVGLMYFIYVHEKRTTKLVEVVLGTRRQG